jgi:dihydrofolate reductase
MRRLIMWNVQTIDGYFEGATPWDLDFHNAVWGDELERFSLEQGQEVGTLLYGRATYEGMASYWTTGYRRDRGIHEQRAQDRVFPNARRGHVDQFAPRAG